MRSVPASKIRPPAPAPSVVPRRRLEECLRASRATCRGTVLLAPAGYGKSTGTALWADGLAEPVAWLSLDPSDDAPLRTAGDGDALMASLLGAALAGAGADTADPRGMLDLLTRLDRAGWSGVVVVDDAHVLGGHGAAALAAWVERAPEGVHTVVLARSGGHLPVARWLVRGVAEVLESDDLRLDRDEARALLAHALPELGAELADRLNARVEGWPAGLHLAVRSLRGRADPADLIDRFTGTDRYVLAFLTEEVLLRLPDELHEIVLLLALEPRVCAGLLAALTGRADAAALLERLEAHEAFIERLDVHDAHAPWFRFPGFFRDLLAHRLGSLRPGAVDELRERSRAWWDGAAATDGTGDGRAVAAAETLSALTPREREVLALLARGATTKALARALEVSPNTVKTHTRHLFEKLGVRTRTEAAARARALGLVGTAHPPTSPVRVMRGRHRGRTL